MIDREKVLTVLRRRFPGASLADVAAAANAIVGLPDEWDDITDSDPDLLARLATSGWDHESADPPELRVFRRRSA